MPDLIAGAAERGGLIPIEDGGAGTDPSISTGPSISLGAEGEPSCRLKRRVIVEVSSLNHANANMVAEAIANLVNHIHRFDPAFPRDTATVARIETSEHPTPTTQESNP